MYSYINSSLVRKLKRFVFKKFLFEKNHDINSTIFIEGTSRSGTTWLAEILANYLNYRIIFEPFYPQKVEIFEDFIYKQYIPPDYKDKRYYQIFNKILSGKIRDPWIDQVNFTFLGKGRIIKSIRGCFFLKWLKNNFPMIPILYIIRHPCAVVSSRILRGWKAFEIDLILKQEMLIQDHLKPYLDIILGAKTTLQKNTCLWCIQNLVPLKTMKKEDWKIIPYEYLVVDLYNVLMEVLNYINPKIVFEESKVKNYVSFQSREFSAVVQQKNPLNIWKSRLSKQEISEILDIVKKFSLDHIYDNKIIPNIESLEDYWII